MTHVCFVMHADLFTPWPVVRAARQIDILKGHGYKISVVSWIKGNHNLPSSETREEIRVHRIPLQPPKQGFLRRAMAYRKVIRDMSQKVEELKPDAIVCHDLEILKAGVGAKKKLDVPLFFDAHEDWSAMVQENSKFESKVFAYMEKKLLKHVTYSYTYGDDLTEKYKKMGFPATTLYNSKASDAVGHINEEGIDRFKRGLGLADSDFIVGFAGSVNLENGIQQILDCLSGLPKDIKYLVVGGSGREEELTAAKQYAQKKGVEDKVIFTGRVKSKEMMELISTFQIGTALFQPLSPNHVARVPNKLFDYMALSVPLIVSDFPNMKKIVVSESDCGVAVDPMNTKWISQAIKHFYEHPDEAEKKGANGRRMFETVYCWDVQKKKLLNSHPLWRGEK